MMSLLGDVRLGYTLSYGLLVRNSGNLELVAIHCVAERSSQVTNCSMACCDRSRPAFSTYRFCLVIGSGV